MSVGTDGRLGVGLVGSGFMGRAHAFAFNAVWQLFDLPLRPDLAVLADADQKLAEGAARRLGFAKAVGDWRALVADPAVDVVSITTPNTLHKPIALAAIQAGKAVYCEKPLAATLADAKEMADAATGRVTLVGFNYLKNPIVGLAREIATSGEIGEIVSFRGIHAEDYMCDPALPHNFRTDPAGGGGVLMDLGSHIVSLARYLVGPIAEVSAATGTVHKTRPSASGPRVVEVDDHGHFVARFENGALGTISASWLTPGRKMQLDFELIGTRGSLVFTQERFNELKLYVGEGKKRDGFKTLLAGPDTPPYGNFCPAPGHQLGFNDMKTIEVAHLIQALAGKERASPDFREAYEIQRVITAALTSGRERAWVEVARL